MQCTICKGQDQVKHLEIYAFGSEGVDACIGCRRKIAGFVLELALQEQRQRKEKFKQARLAAGVSKGD